MNKAFEAAMNQTKKKLEPMKKVILEKLRNEDKRYYREWLGSWGWGVMLAYDTVIAKNKNEANMKKPSGMYAYDESFENIIEVKKEHLHLTDHELSKIYGEKEEK